MPFTRILTVIYLLGNFGEVSDEEEQREWVIIIIIIIIRTLFIEGDT